MVKLQGSIILANTGTVIADNVASNLPQHNGKVTIITNMTDSTPYHPQVGGTDLNATPVFGVTRNDPVLTGTNPLYDTLTNHPDIGQLTIGAGRRGTLNPGFWNEASVVFPALPNRIVPSCRR